MAIAKHDINIEVATEATPLSLHSQQRMNDLQHQQTKSDYDSRFKKHAASVLVVFALFLVAASSGCILLRIFQARSFTDDAIVEDAMPSERQDVVENFRPVRRSIILPAPQLYLSGRHSLLGRRQRNSNSGIDALDRGSTLRWGILGPGMMNGTC